MSKLFCAYIRQNTLHFGVGHCESLVEIPQRCTQLTIWIAYLADNRHSELRIRIFYINRILKFLFILPHKLAPFPRPRIVNPRPMLWVAALFGDDRTEILHILILGSLFDIAVLIEKRQSSAAVRVHIEVQIKLLDGKIVLSYFVEKHIALIHSYRLRSQRENQAAEKVFRC